MGRLVNPGCARWTRQQAGAASRRDGHRGVTKRSRQLAKMSATIPTDLRSGAVLRALPRGRREAQSEYRQPSYFSRGGHGIRRGGGIRWGHFGPRLACCGTRLGEHAGTSDSVCCFALAKITRTAGAIEDPAFLTTPSGVPTDGGEVILESLCAAGSSILRSRSQTGYVGCYASVDAVALGLARVQLR